MKIEMNKKYRRVGTHEEVRVICVDRKGKFSCVGLYAEDGINKYEYILSFNSEGEYYGDKIVEEVLGTDWSKVKRDSRITVDALYPRYFSHYCDGMVYYFAEGKTSYTTCNVCVSTPDQVILVDKND